MNKYGTDTELKAATTLCTVVISDYARVVTVFAVSCAFLFKIASVPAHFNIMKILYLSGDKG